MKGFLKEVWLPGFCLKCPECQIPLPEQDAQFRQQSDLQPEEFLYCRIHLQTAFRKSFLCAPQVLPVLQLLPYHPGCNVKELPYCQSAPELESRQSECLLFLCHRQEKPLLFQKFSCVLYHLQSFVRQSRHQLYKVWNHF